MGVSCGLCRVPWAGVRVSVLQDKQCLRAICVSPTLTLCPADEVSLVIGRWRGEQGLRESKF